MGRILFDRVQNSWLTWFSFKKKYHIQYFSHNVYHTCIFRLTYTTTYTPFSLFFHMPNSILVHLNDNLPLPVIPLEKTVPFTVWHGSIDHNSSSSSRLLYVWPLSFPLPALPSYYPYHSNSSRLFRFSCVFPPYNQFYTRASGFPNKRDPEKVCHAGLVNMMLVVRVSLFKPFLVLKTPLNFSKTSRKMEGGELNKKIGGGGKK